MKLQLISLTMILSSLFSCGQKTEYETIYQNAKFYEFNAERDKIYIYSYDKLSVYDINTSKLSIIDTNIYAETIRLRFPFLLDKTGLIYFVTNAYVYKIKAGKIIKEIPFIYEEYSSGGIDSEYLENEKRKMKIFNKLLVDYTDNDITKLMDDVYILNYKDGHSVAFEHRRLKDDDLTEENKAKILKYAKQLILDIDTSYSSKLTKRGATLAFDNKKVIIKEESYSCRKTSIMSLVSGCKYKMDIEFNNKTIKLKDTKRRTRLSYVDDGGPAVNLNQYLPNSRHITDKNGDIYLLFWEGDTHNLIKIPINQFN